MKKILFSLALFIGCAVAANAQTPATSTPGNVPSKPKSVVEVSKANQATAPSDTAKTAPAVKSEKQCAKKSCCKKDAAATPATGATGKSCSHEAGKGGACCKDKKADATKKD